MTKSSAPTVKSADRLMALFEYLVATPAATLANIARDLGIPASSAYQLVATALSRGFVGIDPKTREYFLGRRFWEIAQASIAEPSIAAKAQNLMDTLAETTQETVQLARLDGLDNVYLAIAESPLPMKLVSRVGLRLPAHATGVGKTLLATVEPDEMGRRLEGVTLAAFTENTITDPSELMMELDLIRRRGYGEDREEYMVGCRCVAMPVRDRHDRVVAAMSVSVPTPRFTPKLERVIHAELRHSVLELERRLGAGPAEASDDES